MTQTAETTAKDVWSDGRHVLTASSTRAHKKCPYLYYLQYVLGIRPAIEEQALRFGKAWHRCLELLAGGQSVEQVVAQIDQWYAQCPTHVELTDWHVERETLAAAISAYDWFWKIDPAQVEACEQTFNLPIVNPETGAASTKWRMAGKIDKRVRRGERLLVREHKSSSADLSPQSDYWLQKRLDSQISFYVLAGRQLAGVAGVDYDVFRKPQIRPSMLTQAETKAFVQSGEYCGDRFDVYVATDLDGGPMVSVDTIVADVKLGAAPKPTKANPNPEQPFAIRETPAMFGARLVQTICAEPARYFARQEIARTELDLEQFRHELWAQMQAINDQTLSGRFFRNENACLQKGDKKCPYCSICWFGCEVRISDDGSIIEDLPDGFEIKPFMHEELLSDSSESD